MSYEHWVADAVSLEAQLPENSAIRDRVAHLTHTIALRAIEAVAAPLDESTPNLNLTATTHTIPADLEKSFLVIDKSTLNHTNTGPAIRPSIQSLGFVVHGSEASLMALGEHNPNTAQGNAHIFLHELTHITERHEGIVNPLAQTQSVVERGRLERRAYSLNTEILSVLDAEGFDAYVEQLLAIKDERVLDRSLTEITTDTSSKNPYKPQQGTLLEEMWQEGNLSRTVALTMAQVNATERRLLAQDANDEFINFAIGHSFGTGYGCDG